MLSEERAPSSVVVPEPGGTPLAQGEGSELGIGPDPKAPQRMLIVGQQPNRLRDPPKNAWFRADGMLDNACKDAAAS